MVDGAGRDARRAAGRRAGRSSSSTRACPGEGTRSSSWRPARRPGPPTSRPRCGARVEAMSSSRRRDRSASTCAKLAEGGGIVEERIVGEEIRSPSVQLRVTPLGEVELLSTHDQLLGGPSGQSYLGCRFPADFGYARCDHARGGDDRRSALAREGVLGRFAHRLRRGPRRGRRVDAVRDRAQPAQGRDDPPVPHAAVPHRRPLRPGDRAVPGAERAREAPRRHRPPRVGPAPRARRSTTCSTSSPATGCTSTSPARSASCST